VEKLRTNWNPDIYQNWKPKEWERKTWMPSAPKREKRERIYLWKSRLVVNQKQNRFSKSKPKKKKNLWA